MQGIGIGVPDTSGKVLSTFSVRDLSPALWLRPEDLVSGVVTTWTDRSGNGNDATQSTAAKKPLIDVDSIDGRNAAEFDGIDDYLDLDVELSSGAPWEAWFVAYRTSAGASHFLAGGASNTLDYILGNLNDPGQIVTSQADDAADTISTAVLDTAAWHLWRIGADGGGNLFAHQDGSDVTSGAPTTTGTQKIGRIGARSNLTGYWPGKFAEIVIVAANLSGASLTSLLAHFSSRYPSLGI